MKVKKYEKWDNVKVFESELDLFRHIALSLESWQYIYYIWNISRKNRSSRKFWYSLISKLILINSMNSLGILIIHVGNRVMHSPEQLLCVLTHHFVRKIYFIFDRSFSNWVWMHHITLIFDQEYLELFKIIINYI